jgi:AcrR family transcriptional regulator
MPKIVDHDARREEIVDAVWRVISRDGIASATTRAIAEEAGCSNGVLSHYFPDKTALLHAALQIGYRRTEEKVQQCLASSSGLAALRAILLLTVPITTEALVGNQVELAFLGHAVGNRKLQRQHHALYERFRGIVRQLLLDARRAGEIAPDTDVDVVADTLVAMIDGLGMEACLFPDVFPPERQRAVVDVLLRSLAEPRRGVSLRMRAKSSPRRAQRKRAGARA